MRRMADATLMDTAKTTYKFFMNEPNPLVRGSAEIFNGRVTCGSEKSVERQALDFLSFHERL
jgi:hypothetical protein